MIYLPDPQYNPNFIKDKELTTKTLLQKGITIGKFLKNTGSHFDFDNILYATRLTIARNLYLQGEFMRVAQRNTKFRLVVSEGLYKPAEKENVTSGGINDLRQTGRAIVYELYNKNGNLAVDSTFDVVNYLRIASRYEKLILAYDTFTGSNLHASIVAIMPSVPSTFSVNFKYDLETQLNNKKQSSNEIIEIRL
jgi:hypothetical protein|tara:strand:- start:10222 stop:10803 length:582 start_codon:yes stop_codon:yes gene_type:complete